MHYSVSLILLWDTDRLSFPSFYFIYYHHYCFITIAVITILRVGAQISLWFCWPEFWFGRRQHLPPHYHVKKKTNKTKIPRLKIAHWSLKLTNRSCNKIWQNCSFYGISTWSKAKCLHILEYLQKRKKEKKTGKLALVNNEVNLTSAKKIAKNWN